MKSSWIEKNLRISLTRSAREALAERQSILIAEMELLFSCLIRKRVYFKEADGGSMEQINEHLAIRFRPVVTRQCRISGLDGPPPVEDFPLKDAARFLPRWLVIDYRHGQWAGEFGY